MKHHRSTVCPGRRLLTAVLLAVVSLAGVVPVRAEEPPRFLGALRVTACDWLVDSVLGMPEMACVDREIPGGLRGLIPAEAIARLNDLSESLVWIRLEGDRDVRAFLRRGDELPRSMSGRGGVFGLFEALMRPGPATLPDQAPADAEPFPPFPDGSGNADISGWLDPKALARLLTSALKSESGRTVTLGIGACRRNSRRIGRLLDGDAPKGMKEGQPVELASMPVCPFGGRYLLDRIEGAAAKRIHRVRCDHRPPAEPPIVPDSPLGKALGIVLQQLEILPSLSLRYSASAGILRVELPEGAGGAGYTLPETPWNPDYASQLSWVPADRVKLPLSSGFPGGLFLGIDPRRLYGSTGEVSETLKTLDVQPGIVLLGGADPQGGQPLGGGMPNPVIGIAASAATLVPALAATGVRISGRQLTEELEGVDVPVWPLEEGMRMRGVEKPALHVLEHDGMTFLSFERRFVRELLRSWNGESAGVVLPAPAGDVKLLLAVRMDVFGHLAAGIAWNIAFRNEARRCDEGVEKWLSMHGAQSRADQERLLGTGEIPAELQQICPAKGIMWHPGQKQVMCAVHGGGRGGVRWSGPPAPSFPVPTDRWLYVTLCRNDGKAVLEARIVTGKEAAK
ncbi:MAG TPA: hypothetical protein PLP29_00050 [Candidatus Ozemobacteraceae bacterium]|nr:hypothetical protein [Candidatus Ozemobacteraceae bacterium]